jgi:predicted nucleic acid-binding protein
MKQHVLFDTSSLVGAALRAESVPDRALMKALELYDHCVSAELLAELESVLAKKKFEKYIPAVARRAFVAFIRENSLLFAVDAPDLAMVAPRCRDVSDDRILA